MEYEMRDDFLPFPIRGSKVGGAFGRVPSGMIAGSAAALGALAGCGGDDVGGGAVGVGVLNETGDMLLGGDGNDRITNRGEVGAIEAGGGDDTIFGAAVAEAIRAGAGNDVIDGGAGDDTIDGGVGDDMIIGGVGDDRMNGGEGGADSGGFDTAVYEDAWTGYRLGGERASGEWAVFTVLDMDAGDGMVDEGEDELTGFEAIRFGRVTLEVVETGTDAGDILIGSERAADGSAEAAFDGGAGDDMIFGFGGGDTIAGGEGGDVIAGGAGDDTLYGHSAESNGGEAEGVIDTAAFGGAPSGFRITAELGDFGHRGMISDVVQLTVMDIDTEGDAVDEGTDTLIGFEALRFDEASSSTTLLVTRTASDDGEVLLGTEGPDGTLDGMGGDDLLFGFEGDDTILGGAGSDIISGGAGADTVTGGPGDDRLFGHAEDGDGDGAGVVDTAVYVDARAGYLISAVPAGANGAVLAVRDADTTAGDEGVDTLTGFEALRFGDGTFRVAGSGSNGGDILLGTDGNDSAETTLHGMDGRDTIFGFAGDDIISGGDGDDILDGGAGDDILDGGDHDTADTAVYHGRYNGGIGSDYVFQTIRIHENGVAVDLLTVTDIGADGRSGDGVDEGRDILRGVEFLNFADQRGVATSTVSTTLADIVGDGLDNTLEGDIEDQRISGGGGADRIFGGGGNDRVDGGADDDTFVFVGERQFHTVTLASDGAGADSIVVSDGIGGAAVMRNIESVEFADATLEVSGTGDGSDANDIVFGAVENDTVSGGLGGDVIFGFHGVDAIEGGEGDDVIDGGAGNDTAVYAGAIRDFQITRENVALVVRDARAADGVDEGRDTLTNVEILRFGNVEVAVSDIHFATGNSGQVVGHATRSGVFHGEGGGYTFVSFGASDRFQFLTGMDSTSSSKTTILGFDGSGGDRIALADIDALRGLGAEMMTDDEGTFTRLGHDESDFELDIRGHHADILDHINYIGGKTIGVTGAFQDTLPLTNGSGRGLPDLTSWFDHAEQGETLSFGATVDGTDLNAAGIGLTLSADGVLTGVYSGTSNAKVRVTVTQVNGERANAEFTIAALTGDLDGTADGETLVDSTTLGRVVNGLGGDDVIHGGEGDDALHGGSATVGVAIGTDNDIAVYDGALDGYRVWAEWVTIGGVETPRFTVRDIRGEGADDEGEDTAVGFEVFRFGDGDRRVVNADNATEANDIVFGTDAGGTVDGNGGADLIFGFGGVDILNGGAGGDMMMGGGGGDTLDGGAGRDIAVYRGARIDYTVTELRLADGGIRHEVRDDNPVGREGDGTDILMNVEALRFLGDDPASSGGDTVDISPEWVIEIRGSSGPDVIEVGDGPQTIAGGGGADTISGGPGADTIAGGEGDDVIHGHRADDHVETANEIDTAVFAGSAASYSVTAVIGNSPPGMNGIVTFTVRDIDADGNGGDDGMDTVDGFEAFRFGSDTFAVVRADRAGGNGVNEIVIGSMGADVGGTAIDGGLGDDLIFGFGGGDAIDGGEGEDTIMGGDGDDVIEGGIGGLDTAVFRGDRDEYKITAVLRTNGESTQYRVDDEMPNEHEDDGEDILTGIENLRFIGDALLTPTVVAAALDSANVILGSSGRDDITGGDEDQEIEGGADNDTIAGGGGNDTITGGDGDDVIEGGHGAMDTAVFRGERRDYEITANLRPNGGATQYTVDDEMPIEHGDDGEDTLTGIEILRFIGTSPGRPDDLMVDISMADVINGSSDGETINGGNGSQEITGGGGRDIIDGGLGADVAVFAGPLSGYKVYTSEIFSDYSGITVEDTSPSSYGSDGIDILNGIEKIRFGSETNAPKTFTVGKNSASMNEHELLLGIDGNQTMQGLGGDDIIFGFGGRDEIFGGTGNDLLYGGAGNDKIYGNAGNDIIHGGTGTDTIYPGGGTDLITVDTTSGSLDNIIFVNSIERFSFYRDGRDKIGIEDLASSGSVNHEGRNTIEAKFFPATSKSALAFLNFGGSPSYSTKNIHHETTLSGNRTYSNQSDIIRIDSYSGSLSINTGLGLDTILLASKAQSGTQQFGRPGTLSLPDFERGDDKIAFDPDWGTVSSSSGGSGVNYSRLNGGVYFTKQNEFTIFIPGVPDQYPIGDLYYVIGETSAPSGFLRPDRKKEVVASGIDEDGIGGNVGDGSFVESKVVNFHADGDWDDMSGNFDIGSSPAMDDFAPKEFEARIDGGGVFSVCEDYLCITMI